MHRTDPAGHVIESLCDYCRRVWQPDGDEIMIEGHQGSLICLKCLSAAYSAVVLHKLGGELAGQKCTMCLEDRDQPHWESPLHEGVRVCLRCIKQAATALEKDPDTGWKRPTSA